MTLLNRIEELRVHDSLMVSAYADDAYHHYVNGDLESAQELLESALEIDDYEDSEFDTERYYDG